MHYIFFYLIYSCSCRGVNIATILPFVIFASESSGIFNAILSESKCSIWPLASKRFTDHSLIAIAHLIDCHGSIGTQGRQGCHLFIVHLFISTISSTESILP
jgi:hypothetical protein